MFDWVHNTPLPRYILCLLRSVLEKSVFKFVILSCFILYIENHLLLFYIILIFLLNLLFVLILFLIDLAVLVFTLLVLLSVHRWFIKIEIWLYCSILEYLPFWQLWTRNQCVYVLHSKKKHQKTQSLFDEFSYFLILLNSNDTHFSQNVPP